MFDMITELSGTMYFKHGDYMVEFSIANVTELPVGIYPLIITIL